ncbi:MAG: MBL fold metallo-hydrolase [Christensenellaceae bacterium]|nr:MBL fold metallo-hydrolase [Christensenellaceae bacterium]
MELTVLGMNGPFPSPGGATSGYLVSAGETRVQLDLGSGTLAALTAVTAPESLTALVLSHWHYDHCSDVLPLVFRLEAMAQEPLHIYAPADEHSLVRQAVQGCAKMTLHDIAPGDEITLGDMKLTAYQARHPVPALMYRLEAEGKTLCYTGDTNTVDGLVDFARKADLLLADGLFPQAAWAEGKPHLSAALAAETARDAQVKRLVVTHLNPLIDPVGLISEARAIRPDVIRARRGDVYIL